MLVVYVDDILGGYNNAVVFKRFADVLKAHFSITDLGEPNDMLGLHVTLTRTPTSYAIHLDQAAYIEKLLDDANMFDCKPVPTPAVPNQKLVAPTSAEMEAVQTFPFRRFLGALLWLSNATRFDIAYAVHDLARFTDKFGTKQWAALKRILRYLKGSISLVLTFSGSASSTLSPPTAYCDSDWAGNLDTRRSTSGILVLTNGPVEWRSKLQRCTAMSTAEAELIAIDLCVREVKWIRTFFSELGFSLDAPTQVNVDNQSAIAIAEHSIHNHRRIKHIDLRYFYVRELIASKIIKLHWLPSSDNLSDILTKALSKQTFDLLLSRALHTE